MQIIKIQKKIKNINNFILRKDGKILFFLLSFSFILIVTLSFFIASSISIVYAVEKKKDVLMELKYEMALKEVELSLKKEEVFSSTHFNLVSSRNIEYVSERIENLAFNK